MLFELTYDIIIPLNDSIWGYVHDCVFSQRYYCVSFIIGSFSIQFKADPTLLDIDGHFALDYATDERIKDSILNDMAKNGKQLHTNIDHIHV